MNLKKENKMKMAKVEVGKKTKTKLSGQANKRIKM